MAVEAVIIAVLAVLGAWLVATYNQFVRLRQYCRESWATIETELERRHDLVPNLVEAVRAYAAHEKQVLQAVTEARLHAAASRGGPRDKAAGERPLIEGTQHLLAVAEGYPQLRASDNFLALQADLADTEDRIQAARRLYNANVRELNTRLQSFPAKLVGSALGFTAAEFFEVERAVIRQVVDVTFV